MTEGADEVALLDPSGVELLGATTTAKLEDQIAVLGAYVDLAASLWVSISRLAAARLGMDAISYPRALRAQPKKARNLWRRTRSWSQRRRCFTSRCLGSFAV